MFFAGHMFVPALRTGEAQQPTQTAPSITDMHDIVLPEPVSWVPSTGAWYALAAAVAIGICVAVFLAVRRYRANRYRREALFRVDAISAAIGDPEQRDQALRQLPVLVKQVALAFSAREEVARLSGDAWLEFLDRRWDGDRFRNGPGRLLPTIAYGSRRSREAIPDAEIGELTALLRAWIKGHHVRV